MSSLSIASPRSHANHVAHATFAVGSLPLSTRVATSVRIGQSVVTQ